jgi:cytochrome c
MKLEPAVRQGGYTRHLRWVGATSLVLLVASLVAVVQARQPPSEFSPYVDAKGEISLPDDFETTFVHIGTVSVEKVAEKPVSELHATYTRKEDLAAFQRAGKFADGAILVKTVRAVTNDKLTTGAASYGSDVKVWFVMVKDATGRFPDNELWGDGWGWALFEGKDRNEQVAVDYRTECRSCHVPAKRTDWVYTKCYPALAAATQAGPNPGPHPKSSPAGAGQKR